MKKNVLVFLSLSIVGIINAQITINSGTGYYAADLVNYLVPAANVSSISGQNFKGVMNYSGRFQAGHFTTATSTETQMGFSEGIVLSTGNVNQIPLSLGTHPGDVAQMSRGYTSSNPGEIRGSQSSAAQRDDDADNLIAPENYYNAAILEFDFVPISTSLEFNYVFGSEEYDDQDGSWVNYNCSSYNDKFAFILSGPGIAAGEGYLYDGTNLARLTNNSEVGINSVNNGNVGSSGGAPNASNCLAANPLWNNGSSTAEFQGWIDGTQLNGNTIALTASYSGLTAGATYKIRLVISDAKDGAYDSVVYLEAGSFNTNPAPLPIELSQFNGKCIMTGNELSWQTSSESNNDFFELERSTDGENFELINTQAGAGTYQGNSNYSFIDDKPSYGTNYYKLSQTDFNGTKKTVDFISVNHDCTSDSESNGLTSTYNSNDNTISLTLEHDEVGAFEYQVINNIGQVIENKQFEFEGNRKTIQLNQQPTSGIYIIRIGNESKGMTSKLYIK